MPDGKSPDINIGIPPSSPSEQTLRTRIEPKFTTRRSKAKRAAARIQNLEQLAMIDSDTQLPNRRWFDTDAGKKIAEARRNNNNLWLLFMDVDEFKVVNDQFGHSGGDEVLRLFGALHLRKEDTLARIGGDEFAMILGGDTEEDQVGILVDRVRAQLSALSLSVMSGLPVNPNREMLHIPIRREVAFSFGATQFDPREYGKDTTEADILKALTERADHGAAYSKKEGRNMGTITRVVNGVETYTPMKVPTPA